MGVRIPPHRHKLINMTMKRDRIKFLKNYYFENRIVSKRNNWQNYGVNIKNYENGKYNIKNLHEQIPIKE
jgi:DNA/RNA endonuclease G (NUC1)